MTVGRIPKAKTSKAAAPAQKDTRRPRMSSAEQSAEFERVAREHGAEGDEVTFNDALRTLSRPKRTSG